MDPLPGKEDSSVKKPYIAAVGIGLVMALTFFAVPTTGGTDQAQIAKANAQIQQISGQCVAKLHQVDSKGQMDAVAQQCEAAILQVLAALQAELGHSVQYTVSQVCVTNNKVGYTACFDPIHIGGSGG